MRKFLIIASIVFGLIGLTATVGQAVLASQGREFLFEVRGHHMMPTLTPGSLVVTNPFAYLGGEPRRGDVAVFRYRDEKRTRDIARVVGLPGETIEIRAKEVFINGRKLDEPYAEHYDPMSDEDDPPTEEEQAELRAKENVAPVRLGPAEVFILGDNRTYAVDSRTRGPVPTDRVLCRMTRKLF